MWVWVFGLAFVTAKVVELEVASKTGFAFLGKFVFTNDPESWTTVGTIMVNLTKEGKFPHGFPPMNVLLYDDEDGGWPSIYDRGYKDMPCPRYVGKSNHMG